MKEIQMPNIRTLNPLRQGRPTPHGIRRQIPDPYLGLPIVSSLRPAVERLISLYAYGDWKKDDALPATLIDIKQVYPTFPDITFEQFVEYLQSYQSPHLSVSVASMILQIGPQSLGVIEFFSDRMPVKNRNFEFQNWQELSSIFRQIIFLKSQVINEELRHFLLSCGYHTKDLRFIENMPRINSSEHCYPTFVPDSLAKQVSKREWLLELLASEGNSITADRLERSYKSSLE